jgi:uncharacterized protein YqfA (UPF0365 family)
MLIVALKFIAFIIVGGALTLTLSMAFSFVPIISDIKLLSLDLALILGLLVALPLAEAIFRRVAWLRFPRQR